MTSISRKMALIYAVLYSFDTFWVIGVCTFKIGQYEHFTAETIYDIIIIIIDCINTDVNVMSSTVHSTQ